MTPIRLDSVTLRTVELSDAGGNYLKWMNDPEVLKYLEARFTVWTESGLRDYITQMKRNPNTPFWAILSNEEHVGNIKLTINPQHKFAEIGIVIGREFWGKSIGTQALKLAATEAFENLNLHKLWAGTYNNNLGARITFQRAGFRVEGCLRNQYLCDGKWTDDILWGLVNPSL